MLSVALACGSIFCGCCQFRMTGADFTECECTIAAPSPQLRRRNQSALYRIAMHVAQLLCDLPVRIDVEVVRAPLPEAPTNRFPQLMLLAPLPRRQQAKGHALLQNLHNNGNRFRFGSLMRMWMCSGMTTNPSTRNP